MTRNQNDGQSEPGADGLSGQLSAGVQGSLHTRRQGLPTGTDNPFIKGMHLKCTGTGTDFVGEGIRTSVVSG